MSPLAAQLIDRIGCLVGPVPVTGSLDREHNFIEPVPLKPHEVLDLAMAGQATLAQHRWMGRFHAAFVIECLGIILNELPTAAGAGSNAGESGQGLDTPAPSAGPAHPGGGPWRFECARFVNNVALYSILSADGDILAETTEGSLAVALVEMRNALICGLRPTPATMEVLAR